MKKALLLALTIYALALTAQAQTRTIFAYGGALQKEFIKQVIALTGKPHPKICYLPTASADNANGINHWYALCHDISVEPY